MEHIEKGKELKGDLMMSIFEMMKKELIILNYDRGEGEKIVSLEEIPAESFIKWKLIVDVNLYHDPTLPI